MGAGVGEVGAFVDADVDDALEDVTFLDDTEVDDTFATGRVGEPGIRVAAGRSK